MRTRWGQLIGSHLTAGVVPAVLEELLDDGGSGPIVLETREPWVLLSHLWEGCMRTSVKEAIAEQINAPRQGPPQV